MFVVGQKATLTSPFLFCLVQSSVCLYGGFSLNLKIFHFMLVGSYFCCLGILLLLVQDVLVQLENAWSTVLGPLHHPQPPILLPLNFCCSVFVCIRQCTWPLFQVSCISLGYFSFLGVLRTSCPPTILLRRPVQL